MSELPGIDEASTALAAGQAVVVPYPSPLPYGVIATSPEAVNVAKRRPPTQPVACWLHDDVSWQKLLPAFDLSRAASAKAYELLRHDMVTLLVPVRRGRKGPAWIAPAVRDGHALLFGGRWRPLGRIEAGFPELYISSANHTGQPPATNVAEVRAMLGTEIAVVDGDSLRDSGRFHASTTMMRIAPDGRLVIVREGIQSRASGPDFE